MKKLTYLVLLSCCFILIISWIGVRSLYRESKNSGISPKGQKPYESGWTPSLLNTASVYSIIVHDAAAMDIHAYDNSGRHTGPAPNPDPQSEFPFFEEQIPNSSIARFGGDWYLTLDGGYTYLVKLQGKEEKYSTMDIILGLAGDNSAPRLTYAIGNVTKSFIGSLRLVPHMNTPPELLIDSDGRKLKPNMFQGGR